MNLGLNLSLTGLAARGRVSGGETAIQQAVTAAWDMQEASGDALPAKGEITLTANNAPGSTTGPAGSLTSRDLDATGAGFFSAASNDVFLAPDSGTKTFRIWTRAPSGAFYSTQAPIFAKAMSAAIGAGDEYGLMYNAPTLSRARIFLRNGADSATTSTPAGAIGSFPQDAFIRNEVQFNAGSNVVIRSYNSATEAEDIITVAATSFNRAANDFLIGAIDTSYFLGDVALFVILNRAFTTAEREADRTPTVFADMGK